MAAAWTEDGGIVASFDCAERRKKGAGGVWTGFGLCRPMVGSGGTAWPVVVWVVRK